MAENPQQVNTRASVEVPLATLFSQGVVTAQARPEQRDHELYPEELVFLERAVPKRRAEFGSVRVCARQALSQLGVAPVAIPSLPDRSPRWPAGVIGSMTHTADYCAAVVAPTSLLRGVGIDAEREKDLEPELVQMICTSKERAFLARRQTSARDTVVYFSAKEAFYKCQYPLTGLFLDFLSVELELDFTSGVFRPRVIKPMDHKPAWLDQTQGRFLRRDGLVVCGAELGLGP